MNTTATTSDVIFWACIASSIAADSGFIAIAFLVLGIVTKWP